MTYRPLLTGLSLALGGLAAFFVYNSKSNLIKPQSDSQYAKASVMITNLAGTSGGSGVILSSSSTGSTVLTNQHVCKLAERGGVKLTTTQGTAIAASYKVSNFHDLCLITTASNLGVSTSVSAHPPEANEVAVSAGHPNLYPLTVSRATFGSHVTIPVMTGTRPCTDDELNSDLAMVCIFLGGIPIVKIYDAIYTSNLIMAGSSGSPIFNEAGEIAALVFAGAGSLSYAFAVPGEYVYYFINTELKNLEAQYPNMELSVADMMGEHRIKNSVTNLLKECEKDGTPESVLKVCNSLSRAIVR